MTETGCYLYAIARGLSSPDLEHTRGMQDAPLRAVRHRGLVAVVSTVGLDEYGDEGLRRNLEDLGWLERTARTHDAVVQAAAVVAPTAPMRLATVFLDDDGVRARLDEWYDALQRTLDRIQGRMEWSVKAFAPASDHATAAVPELSGTGSGSGTAYLMRRKAETTQRASAADAAAAVADAVHNELSAAVVASLRLAPQDRRLAGYEGTMTLNGAYLVDVGAADDFCSVVRRLSAEHPDARIDVQGPWPPYSFATLDDE